VADRSTTFAFIGEDKFSPVAAKVKGQAGGFGGAMGKMKIGAAAAGAAVLAAGKALWDMGVAAAEDQKGQVALAKTLQNTTGANKQQVAATEAWISKQGEALGVSDDQLRPALGRLARSTHDVGKAQGLAALAMDVSAGTGKDLSTVTEALARGADGNTGALKRLGVQTKNADGSTRSFKAITADLAKTFQGQASAAANTAAGKWGRLKLRFDELKESIGAKLLPIAEKFADWIMDTAIPAVQKFAQDIMPSLKSAWEDAKQGFQDAKPTLQAIGKVLGEVAKFIFTKVVPALLKIKGMEFKAVGKAISQIRTSVLFLSAAFLRFAAKAVGAFAALTKAALGAFSGILGAAEKGLGWLPGIGDKIKTAKKNFDDFKDRTVKNLTATSDKLEAAAKKADALARKKPEVKASADTAKANSKLDETGRKADATGRKKPDVKVSASTQAAITRMEGVRTKADQVDRKSPNVNVSASTATANNRLDGVSAALARLNGRNANVSVNVHLRGSATGAAILRGRTRNFAAGTRSAPGGLALVGEAGPELVTLPRGARVDTATRTSQRIRQAGGDGESPTVVQLIVDGRVLVESLVRQQPKYGGRLPLRVTA
jgi:hypothetical protein